MELGQCGCTQRGTSTIHAAITCLVELSILEYPFFIAVESKCFIPQIYKSPYCPGADCISFHCTEKKQEGHSPIRCKSIIDPDHCPGGISADQCTLCGIYLYWIFGGLLAILCRNTCKQKKSANGKWLAYHPCPC